MTVVLHTPAARGPAAAVRLIGVGAAGRRFVERFHTHFIVPAHSPLAELLDQPPMFIEDEAEEGGDATGAIDRLKLESVQILCLAFGVDATPTETEAAMLLLWRMWGQHAHVIGIVIGAQNPPPLNCDETLLGILCESLDARVDVADPADADELAPLQWFYLALQRCVLEGIPVLDAAWDCTDVIEALDFRHVRLELFTQPFDEAGQLGSAMEEALGSLERRGVELEQAHGAMAVLWVPSQYQITVRMMRQLGRTMGERLGSGALHLTIRLRSVPAIGDSTAYLTLIVSVPQARTLRFHQTRH